MTLNRNNRFRYLIPLVLATLVILFMIRERTPFGSRNTSFAIKDKKITKIVFYEGDKKLTLSVKNSEWKVNGSEEARRVATGLLTEVLNKMAIKAPVSSDAFRLAIEKHKAEPVRVQVYGRFRLLKSFFVYKTAENRYGNIMKMRPAAKPFIVWMPGLEDDIGRLFTAEENFWTPFELFRFIPGKISEISVVYPSDTASSFIVKYTENGAVLNAPGLIPLAGDSSKMLRFGSYFTSIRYEGWVGEKRDSVRNAIMAEGPVAEITITDKSGSLSSLAVFRKTNTVNGERITDSDRLFGILNGSEDVFVIRYFDIDPVLKKRKWLSSEL